MQTIWIFGDQLSRGHAALAGASRAECVVLFIEWRTAPGGDGEGGSSRRRPARSHQQKLVLIFSGMRHFAAELAAAGWTVDYHRLPDTPDLETAWRRHLQRFAPTEVCLAAPNTFGMTGRVAGLEREFGVPFRALPPTERTGMFLVTREDFAAWAGDRPHLVMEDHYRRLRRRTGLLMTPRGQPAGGAWNFDPANRRTYREYARIGPEQPVIPAREEADAITREVIAMVAREFPDWPGRAANFWFPVDRAGALRWLDRFIAERLEHFGPFEDVLAQDQPVIYHSVLSPLINVGLLSPAECVERAVAAFADGRAPINSVEGYVRQVIGWREFINGVYWRRGPDYRESNALDARHPLPGWFYDGETEMNCLRQCVTQALDLGWMHHIQRLMVVGNFMLIAGIDPAQGLRWYLEMTVDAYDWVMLANVLGVILYADNGYVATKPYAAGGGYIHKMSNYCEGCRYSPKIKTGPDACPFNYLYWDFYGRHADNLRDNPRVSRAVETWEARSPTDQRGVRRSAEAFLGRQ